jgi:hypothetical protein
VQQSQEIATLSRQSGTPRNDNFLLAFTLILRNTFSGDEFSPTRLSDDLPITHDHFTPDHR